MTKKNNARGSVSRLGLYLFAGVGVLLLVLLGRNMLQPDTADLDSARLAKPELPIGDTGGSERPGVDPGDGRGSAGSRDAGMGSGQATWGVRDVDEARYTAETDRNAADPAVRSFGSARQRSDVAFNAAGGGTTDSAAIAGGGVPSAGADRSTDQDTGGGGLPLSQAQTIEDTDTQSADTDFQAVQDTGIEDPEASDPPAEDAGEGDAGDEEASAEEEPPTIDGTWTGRVESSRSTSNNGDWSCAGGRFRAYVFYHPGIGSYVFSAKILPDSGYLIERSRGLFFNIKGEVSTAGAMTAKSQPLPEYWGGVKGYQAQYSGSFFPPQAGGTWSDGFGCSGTWQLIKQ